MYGKVDYVLFCTTRPWKIVLLSLEFNKLDDKVVDISGLLPNNADKTIEYVLVTFYGLKIASIDYEDKKYCQHRDSNPLSLAY